MSLPGSYVQSHGRIADFLSKMRDANAPDQLTQNLIKDWGFTSSNDRAMIPLLKAIGFLTPDGRPTERYLRYRDHSASKEVLGEALQDAYSDIFLITSNPKESDREAIQGKFKSYHNVSDNVAGLMTKTFFALLKLAALHKENSTKENHVPVSTPTKVETEREEVANHIVPSLHYNIQIHLPATKDVEVYNAIFKSLKEHLID